MSPAEPQASPWRHMTVPVYAVLVLLLLAAATAALLIGPGSLTDESLRPVLLRLRGGRAGAAFIAGAALSVGGVLVQGLFRNPLASPDIIGTSAGAALGGRLALLLARLLLVGLFPAFVLPELLLPFGCMLGALCALLILLSVSRVRDDLVVLLLTGFLLSSLFMSLAGFVMSLAEDQWQLSRAMVIFSLGDVSAAGLPQVVIAAPLVLAGTAAAWFWGRPLDLMLSGEEEAAALGVDVAAVRRWVVVWTALLTGAAVSIGGGVGFVGLVIPHALRPFLGAAHRRLVPAAALLGGTFLLGCDALTRALPTRSEVPLGVITGLIGAPVFLLLLVRSRRLLREG